MKRQYAVSEPPKPAKVAARLNPNQKNTLRNLSPTEFHVLGCSEATAIRMTLSNSLRPALVEEGPLTIDCCRTFRLSEFGALVRGEL